eukprot:10139477-Alexandrium_andersonii.AAC.1
MSASLVGSEMCIRDRPRADLRPDAGPCLSRCGDRSPALPRSLYATRPAAVSYTHLTLPTICSV